MTPLRIAGITLALLLCVGCNSNVMLTLPGTLEGVWTTDDPRFQDRSLELSSSFVIIITGHDDPASVQFVDKVESEPAAEGTSMTVYSTDYLEGAHYQMRLLFSPANGGELRIQNEGRVWKHAAP
ncbi:MAG TPA: hypothetical protein VLL05_00260 [Terriglobales bacterium]|nr:hypothetical protein [Terriglobales bacterium]